jgi:hypothetical protein
MESKILQAIGAVTLVIVLLSVGWSVASATISMNSTGGVDTLKLLKILPSSGDTVNISTTFVINATSGDITKMGKFTQNVEIEKLSPMLIIDANGEPAGSPAIRFQTNGEAKAQLWLETNDTFHIYDKINEQGNFKINVTTGDITKVGNIDMGGNNITNVGNVANFATGTYTGDGSTSLEVNTGLATISHLMIFHGTSNGYFFKTSSHPAAGSHDAAGSYGTTAFASGFSGGSFFVDDNGADANPNTNGVTYYYTAWGT